MSHDCSLRARCRVRTFSVPSAVVTRATTAVEVEEVTQVLLDIIHLLNISIRWSLISWSEWKLIIENRNCVKWHSKKLKLVYYRSTASINEEQSNSWTKPKNESGRSYQILHHFFQVFCFICTLCLVFWILCSVLNAWVRKILWDTWPLLQGIPCHFLWCSLKCGAESFN